MKKSFLLLMMFAVSFSVLAQSASDVLTNTGIIQMHKAGLGAEVMLTSIESSSCNFNVSPTGLIALKKAGIDESVLKAMIEKQNYAKTTSASKESATAAKTTSVKRGSSKFELLNHVYHYDPNSKSSKPLEKAIAGIRTKQGPFGASILLQIEGASSALRLNSQTATNFAVNTGSATLPELVLYKVKVVKGKREVATMKANTFSGVKSGENVITLDISAMSEGVYKITPGKSLEAGEYFITGKPSSSSVTMDAFTFGVD